MKYSNICIVRHYNITVSIALNSYTSKEVKKARKELNYCLNFLISGLFLCSSILSGRLVNAV